MDDLELIGMLPKERWELYQLADSMGLFHKLPPQPKPLADPLVHLYELGAERQLNPFLLSNRPDLSEDERRAAMYAWHVWRERTDVWEMPPRMKVDYDPAWLREGFSTWLLYRQFISAFELEKYIVNPWVRASAWITTLNLLDLEVPPKFDLFTKGHGAPSIDKGSRKYTRSTAHFANFVNQAPTWWIKQKETSRFRPARELGLAISGFVSVEVRDLKGSPQPEELTHGNWHNGWDNDQVEIQKRGAFSWAEFLYRRDELNFVIPSVIELMMAGGPRGASCGSGCREVLRVSEKQLWAVERKLLNRLEQRVITLRRFTDAIGEVAEGQRG